MTHAALRPLLIVEDDPALQKQMRWVFDDYTSVTANDAESALAQLRRHEPPVVTLDLGLPPHPDDPTAGLTLLRSILELAPETKVIVLTGQNDRKNALEAVAIGAFDFHAKPFEPDLLKVVLARAFRMHELQDENRRLAAAAAREAAARPNHGLITQDAETLKVCATLEKVAPSNATVLIQGESGTGKELLARACHALSPRVTQRFVAINCAAIPENLLESELFGFEKGAFTGAFKQTPGKVELAHKGTLFLDEIGDMPLALQAKLLRFLQERVIERIGGRHEIPVDVRIICATHRDLKSMIAEGRFREDLYFRLAEIVLAIPPLRRRAGDAAFIAQALLPRIARDAGARVPRLGADILAEIERQPWPGNVRELESALRRAVVTSEGGVIALGDLGITTPGTQQNSNAINLRHVREEAERAAVSRALAASPGNMSKAAELLGISRPTLYELLDRFGLRNG
jgi:two-component system NtrC family response regulator